MLFGFFDGCTGFNLFIVLVVMFFLFGKMIKTTVSSRAGKVLARKTIGYILTKRKL